MRLLLLLLAVLTAAAAPRPTREIAPYRLTLPGGAVMPLYATADPDHPPPDVTRVVLVLHGLARDADSYFATAKAARDAAGPAGASTLMIAPQVLADEDVAAHHLSPDYLHWSWDRWAGGGTANGPAPVSLFNAYDALLAELADHRRFPALREVVIAGHSAGGQITQRYAVVGNGPDVLQRAGLAVRFVIANPSRHIWFSPERPLPNGGFGVPPQAADCPHYADWRYGLTGTLPPYVTGAPAALEARYISRDVVYLLGTSDINPSQADLDRSCAGETQGPTRYARGHGYFAYLQAREGAALRHREYDVHGVAHNGRLMLTSACALAAMFGVPTCGGASR